MENKTATILTIAFSVLFFFYALLSGVPAEVDPVGGAIGNVESSNVQGVIGIVLLLILVASIFFIVGNIRVMLQENFHKKA